MGGMNMPGVPPLGWHSFLTGTDLRTGWLVAVVLLAAGYLAAVALAARRGSRTAWWRITCYLLGVLVLLITVASGIAVYSHELFWMHMIQHLLLIMVVPALLITGRPVTAITHALPAGARTAAERIGSSPVVRVLTHPAIGFGVYTLTLVITHLSSFPNLMLRSMAVHDAETVLYLVAGCWYFAPLLGAGVHGRRMTSLQRIVLMLIGMAPDTVVGIVLMQSTGNPFTALSGRHPGWGPSPLKDVQTGGAIMWAFGDGEMMAIAVIVMVIWLARRTDVTAGGWLESVRRANLEDSIRRTGGSEQLSESGPNGDLDEDDAALAAYNAMLARMHDRSPDPH